MIRRAAAAAVFVLLAGAAAAGDAVFLNCRYLELTQRVAAESEAPAARAFANDAELKKLFENTRQALNGQLAARQSACREVERGLLFKRFNPLAVEEITDPALAATLRQFNDGLNAIAEAERKPLTEVFPTYAQWNRLEAEVVGKGLKSRLMAYEVRYGPDSERINFLEWVAGEWIFKGTESGPSVWEPIFRVSPVQFTTAGSGLVSTAQLGVNHYFTQGEVPLPLRWIGVTNHLGVAAALQYLDDPELGKFQGPPAWGFVLHLDRREVGLTWHETRKQVRVTLGYAFQFVPMVM